jgi:hypothetical protein
MKRLFANLIDNALRFGGGVTIRALSNGRLVEVMIDDEGPRHSGKRTRKHVQALLGPTSEPAALGFASRPRAQLLAPMAVT